MHNQKSLFCTQLVSCFILICIFMAGSCYWDSEKAFAQTPRNLYSKASNSYWDQDYKRSEMFYKKLIEKYPDHQLYWDGLFGLAQVSYKLNKLQRANNQFERVRNNHPDKSVRGDALFSQIEIAILLDKIVKAKELLQTFLDIYSNHVLVENAKKQLKLLEDVDIPEPKHNEKTSVQDQKSKRSELNEQDSDQDHETASPDKKSDARETPGSSTTSSVKSKKPSGEKNIKNQTKNNRQEDRQKSDKESSESTTRIRPDNNLTGNIENNSQKKNADQAEKQAKKETQAKRPSIPSFADEDPSSSDQKKSSQNGSPEHQDKSKSSRDIIKVSPPQSDPTSGQNKRTELSEPKFSQPESSKTRSSNNRSANNQRSEAKVEENDQVNTPNRSESSKQNKALNISSPALTKKTVPSADGGGLQESIDPPKLSKSKDNVTESPDLGSKSKNSFPRSQNSNYQSGASPESPRRKSYPGGELNRTSPAGNNRPTSSDASGTSRINPPSQELEQEEEKIESPLKNESDRKITISELSKPAEENQKQDDEQRIQPSPKKPEEINSRKSEINQAQSSDNRISIETPVDNEDVMSKPSSETSNTEKMDFENQNQDGSISINQSIDNTSKEEKEPSAQKSTQDELREALRKGALSSTRARNLQNRLSFLQERQNQLMSLLKGEKSESRETSRESTTTPSQEENSVDSKENRDQSSSDSMNNNQNNKSGQRNSSDNNSVKNNQKKGNNSNLGSMSTDESSTDRKKNKEAQAVENSDKSRTESIVKNSQENEKSQGGDSSVEEPGTSEETSKKNTNVNPEKANVNPGLSEQKGPSTNELRAEIRTAMNRDDYQVAWEQTKKLLEREPESQDFYRAAFLQRELTEASEKGLKFINQAISSKQTVPPKYKLIKTDFLLSQKRNQMAEKLLTEISSPMLEELNSNKQSYYYYLNGELQRKKGNNEKAFFEYIESVRSSEDSVWGRKSRKILNNEL